MKAAVSAGIVIEIMSGLTLCWSCVVCTGMYWYVLVQVRTEFLCII